jgi:hypothetical protein
MAGERYPNIQISLNIIKHEEYLNNIKKFSSYLSENTAPVLFPTEINCLMLCLRIIFIYFENHKKQFKFG